MLLFVAAALLELALQFGLAVLLPVEVSLAPQDWWSAPFCLVVLLWCLWRMYLPLPSAPIAAILASGFLPVGTLFGN